MIVLASSSRNECADTDIATARDNTSTGGPTDGRVAATAVIGAGALKERLVTDGRVVVAGGVGP